MKKGLKYFFLLLFTILSVNCYSRHFCLCGHLQHNQLQKERMLDNAVAPLFILFIGSILYSDFSRRHKVFVLTLFISGAFIFYRNPTGCPLSNFLVLLFIMKFSQEIKDDENLRTLKEIGEK